MVGGAPPRLAEIARGVRSRLTTGLGLLPPADGVERGGQGSVGRGRDGLGAMTGVWWHTGLTMRTNDVWWKERTNDFSRNEGARG
jgi:hypothetical protein